MFLNNFHAGAPISSFYQVRDHGIHCTRMSVENELSYLPEFDGSDISVHETGPFIVLEGTVGSAFDCQRAIKTAEAFVGEENVISRLIVVGRNTKSNDEIILF